MMNNTMTSNASGPGMPYSNLHNSKFENNKKVSNIECSCLGMISWTFIARSSAHFKQMAHSIFMISVFYTHLQNRY